MSQDKERLCVSCKNEREKASPAIQMICLNAGASKDKTIEELFGEAFTRFVRIGSSNADIIVLIDLKNARTMGHALGDIGDYDGFVHYYTPEKDSSALGIFYRRNKLFVEEIRQTNNLFGLGLRVLETGHRFWACATHLVVEDVGLAMQGINKMLQGWSMGLAPCFIAGDFGINANKKNAAEFAGNLFEPNDAMVRNNEERSLFCPVINWGPESFFARVYIKRVGEPLYYKDIDAYQAAFKLIEFENDNK